MALSGSPFGWIQAVWLRVTITPLGQKCFFRPVVPPARRPEVPLRRARSLTSGAREAESMCEIGRTKPPKFREAQDSSLLRLRQCAGSGHFRLIPNRTRR